MRANNNNNNALLFVGVALVGFVLYKKYVTQPDPAITPLAKLNLFDPGLAQPTIQVPSVAASFPTIRTGPKQLNFDNTNF